MSLAIKNSIYQHYKNKKLYLVQDIAKHTETEEEMVIYHSLYENSYWHGPWVRPIEIFEDVVEYEGEMVDRFKLLGDMSKAR